MNANDDAPAPPAAADPPPPAARDTPAKLRAAARKLFARRGYDGASIRAITSAAGANLGSVTYHFGSKKALYEAVLEEVLTPLARGVADTAAGPAPPMERIGAVERLPFRHLGLNPDLPQLLAFLSMFLFVLPAIILSGFLYPVETMPPLVQWLTLANPLRHFLEVVRGIFLKGAGMAELWPRMVTLAAMAAAVLALATRRFRAGLA